MYFLDLLFDLPYLIILDSHLLLI